MAEARKPIIRDFSDMTDDQLRAFARDLEEIGRLGAAAAKKARRARAAQGER